MFALAAVLQLFYKCHLALASLLTTSNFQRHWCDCRAQTAFLSRVHMPCLYISLFQKIDLAGVPFRTIWCVVRLFWVKLFNFFVFFVRLWTSHVNHMWILYWLAALFMPSPGFIRRRCHCCCCFVRSHLFIIIIIRCFPIYIYISRNSKLETLSFQFGCRRMCVYWDENVHRNGILRSICQ